MSAEVITRAKKKKRCVEISEQNRGFKGVWIDQHIYLHPNLSLVEKILFAEINSLNREPNGCFASNEYFAKFLGTSPQTITNGISKLKKEGLVWQESFNGRQRVLKTLKIYSLPIKDNEAHIYSNTCIGISLERKDILRDTESVPLKDIPKFIRTSHKNNSIQKALHQKLLQKPTKPTQRPIRRLHPLVEYWNSLPNTPKHTDANSKTHRGIIQKINALKAGKFDQYSFHPDWLKNNAKVVPLLTKHWSNKELQEVVLRLSHLMDPAYKGAFKKKVSLNDLLYSIYHNSSVALTTWLRPPVLLSEAASEEKINPKHKPLIDRLIPWLQEGRETKLTITNKLKAELSGYIIKLEQTYQAIEGKFCAQSWHTSDSLTMARSYLCWLEDRDVHPNHRRPNCLDVNSWSFKEYANVFLEESNRYNANKSLGSILVELKIWNNV